MGAISRKHDEAIVIGPSAVPVVVRVIGRQTRLYVETPDGVVVEPEEDRLSRDRNITAPEARKLISALRKQRREQEELARQERKSL